MKKAFKILGSVFLGLIVVVFFAYARIAFINDYSFQKPVESPLKDNSVHLVSFASGEVFIQNQNSLLASAINKGFSSYRAFGKSQLDQKFIKQNKVAFSHSKGGGLMIWKPYVIEKALSSIPEGDWVIYMDAGFIFQGPIAPLFKDLGPEVSYVFQKDGWDEASLVGSNECYTRRSVIERLCGKHIEKCRKDPLISSSFMMVRNDLRGQAMIRNWKMKLEEQENLNLLPRHKSDKKNYPGFLWHHLDQAVLSNLISSTVQFHDPRYAKFVTKSDVFPTAVWTHRRGGASTRFKHLYSHYGAAPTLHPHTKSAKALSSISPFNNPVIVHLRHWINQAIGM